LAVAMRKEVYIGACFANIAAYLKPRFFVGFNQSSTYVAWRRQFLRDRLREITDDAPPEHLMQVVWQHQRLHPGKLKLSDGRPVRILHPGFCSLEGGPDFRNAVIRLGDEEAIRGDVEIDVECSGWKAHGHDRNPAFRNTILRVVWKKSGRNTELVLPMRPALDSPWSRLAEWAITQPLGDLPSKLRGACCAPLTAADGTQLAAVLREAGQVRLGEKGEGFRTRARQVGWEQSLWEGLFAALGYKHNQWPMRRVAEQLPFLGKSSESNALRWQAILLGVSGLLPVSLPAEQKRSVYLRELWDIWWRVRDSYTAQTLPSMVWRLGGVRPVNRPERRLALAADWLAHGELIRRVEDWVSGTHGSPRKAAVALEQTLADSEDSNDSFWRSHYTFAARELSKPGPLLGAGRTADLAVNVILPWLWARAKAGKNGILVGRIEEHYFTWPKAADNAVLKFARQRLLGSPSQKLFKTAAAQQGLLQIVRDFCAHTDALCTDCPFPNYVRSMTRV
jgi:hypothetical protein